MAAPTPSFESLRQRLGQEIGVSDWFLVSQERIDAFAGASEDRQWIHVDPVRAARESPYHATIAHGFLTLSLLSHLHSRAVQLAGPFTRVINYGLNRVRFPAPVLAGALIRARSVLQAIEEKDDAWQVTWQMTIEIQGQAKPALVADWLVRYYRD